MKHINFVKITIFILYLQKVSSKKNIMSLAHLETPKKVVEMGWVGINKLDFFYLVDKKKSVVIKLCLLVEDGLYMHDCKF